MQPPTAVNPLDRVRFSGDVRCREHIRTDSTLRGLIDSVDVRGAGNSARQQLLADAVRVDEGLLPSLSRTVTDVAERTGITIPLEFYVYAGAEINAAVTRTRTHALVMLSSAAVEKLSPEELEFVVGHELGHAHYGHLDLPVVAALRTERRVDPRHAMRLLAWQRKGEVSADRAGLLCCGSFEIAARALFKTLSGLSMPGMNFNARVFAGQWDDLAREIGTGTRDGHWNATHPFPALRIKALEHFWRTDRAGECIPGSGGAERLEHADREIESLLAMMDPLAREREDIPDPMLVPFLLWGSLYVAAANGNIEDSELEDIGRMVGREALGRALAGGTPTVDQCWTNFEEARRARARPLTALDLHRIFTGLGVTLRSDGSTDADEIEALNRLASACGVSEVFITRLIGKAA